MVIDQILIGIAFLQLTVPSQPKCSSTPGIEDREVIIKVYHTKEVGQPWEFTLDERHRIGLVVDCTWLQEKLDLR